MCSFQHAQLTYTLKLLTMNVLAIDTSTAICSVALLNKGRQFKRRAVVSGKHSSVLFEQIQQVVKEANCELSEIESVIYAAGPGSYTGLRVGGSAIKGLLFPHSGIPFYAASTLASFACCAITDVQPRTIHALIDARRQHAYYQSFSFDGEQLRAESQPEIKLLTDIRVRLMPGDHVIGTGLSRLSQNDLAEFYMHPEEDIDATGLLKLISYDKEKAFIRTEDIRLFEPDYMSGSTWNHAN